ncbi:MAG TPA: adenine phosphoribosyltransferase, partial [Microlunatus sp.]
MSRLAELIRDVPDFPEPGVVFRDITPLIGSAGGLAAAVDALLEISPADVDAVFGIEARGFIFAAPVALALGVGLVPVRKPAKLPRETVSVRYDLEYGTETLAIHA